VASEQARQLRQQGIAAAKAGQKDEARRLLQQSIRLEPQNEAAWLWMASIATDQRERLFCLYKLLEINPNHEAGLKALGSLGLTREQLAEQLGQATPAVSADASGIPLPDPQRIAAAQSQVDMIVREYLAPIQSDIKYVHKTRQRAGERDVVYLRIYVAIGAVVLLLVLGILGYSAAVNTPEIASILFAPTPTITNTPAPPTLTPTNTPGVTPTSSPTPLLTLTPSPTVPPEIRAAPPGLPPTPTDIYPSISERTLRGAVVLLDQNRYDIAQPTLEAERELTGARFNPVPYYYEAVAWLQAGDTDRALRVLQDAETRILDEGLGDEVKPLIDTGFAQVNLKLAQDARESGETGQVEAYLAVVEQRAEAAITTDPLLAQPYLLLARRHSLTGNFDEALGVLDRGLSIGQLAHNVNFIVEKGNIYLQQREFDQAAYQAFLALYIDPLAEPAHILRIRAALAQNDPGLAVIYAQEYLFYYPGSALGYVLLGEARVMEGNTDLALMAFNQALTADETNPAVLDALVQRAAIYRQQRRYDLARQDLTRALELSEDDPNIRALRMQAAYESGNYAVAQDDAEELLGEGVVSDAALRLLQARILVDDAGDSEDYRAALQLLGALEGLPAELQPIAAEYQARAHFSLGNYGDALNAIDRALAGGETGSRRYLRGQILEARNEPEEALREYEWVLTWGEVYPYSFLPEVEARVEALRDE
jgi:tetratricopeptide (TPR) repeat protein